MLSDMPWRRNLYSVLGALFLLCTANPPSPHAAEAPAKERLTLPGESCGIPALAAWTIQEKWVWERVCVGDTADFNRAEGYGGNLDPRRPDAWPNNRALRPAFLETILLHEPYRGALTRNGARIIGARFTVPLDLSKAALSHPLRLDRCRFESTVDLSYVKTSHVLSLDGSTVAGELIMDSLRVGPYLFMRGAHFGGVNLLNAKVEGALEMDGSTFTGKLSLDSLQVGRSLFMRNRAQFAEVNLINAKVEGTLDMDGSTVTGELTMDSLRVGPYLFMRGARFGEVNLLNAKVEGTLEMDRSTFTGKLSMNSLQVGRSLFMRDRAQFAEVSFVNAKIGSALEMDGSTFTGKLTMDSLQVGGNLFMRRADARRSIPSLIFADIGSNLDLSGSLLNSLDLTGTRVRGELRLGSRILPATQWEKEAALVLRNTDVGALQDLPEAWPADLDLNGFVYARLGGFGAEDATRSPTRDISAFTDWLRKHKRYSPQPYEHLASILRRAGEPDKADSVLYAARERERDASTGLTRLKLTLLKVFIGYGYRTRYSLYWSLGLIVVGALVLKVSGQGLIHRMPYGIAYSVDMLLPIIKLRGLHDEIDLAGWARYYFYFHMLMGYVLASFLIAGLSGLTK